MKKILFCMPNMNLGGTEKALLSLLSMINLSEYKITIALIQKTGKLLNDIPSLCEVIELPICAKIKDDLLRGGAVKNFIYYLKKFNIFRASKIALKKVFGNMFAELRGGFDKINALDGEYDIAVSYQLHNPFITKYVIDKINAKKKVVFVHNDFKTTKFELVKLKNELDKYDKIYTVSQYLKDEFCEILPDFSNKVDVFYNIVNAEKIIQLANEFYPLEYVDKSIKILTVGRLNPQKGYNLAINVAKKLNDNNFDFKWFVIGEGELMQELTNTINYYGLKDKFYLLGSKINPYPYIKNCDIYCQPSLHEGYCTTTNEAKLLNKAIITTNVSGANEQFENMKNALICDINSDKIYEGITLLINKEEVARDFVNNLSQVNWHKENIMLLKFLEL